MDAMLKLTLDSRDVNMGNEDRWTLCFDEEKGRFFVQHWRSHRKSGSSFDFESDTEERSVEEFKELIAERLKANGFSWWNVKAA
nr:putative integron gene cassette protein [uncultured bacterium]